jgi:hypothetical protein
VIAGKDAEAARIDGQGLVQAELGGEVSHRAGAQHARVVCAPGAVGAQIFLLAAVDVIDAAVQQQLARAAIDFPERHLVQERNGILIELAPAHRVQIAKDAGAVVIPAPPHVAGQLPEFFLGGGYEAVEGARLTDDGRNLAGGVGEHADLALAEDPRLLGLDHEHALQNAAVDDGHAEKGVVFLFAGILEVLVAGMIAGVRNSDGKQLLGDETGETFIQRHAQGSDTSRMEAQRGGKNQVRAVGLEQVSGTDVGAETRGDERDDVHERIGRLALVVGEAGDVLEGQNQIGVCGAWNRIHRTPFAFR